MSDRTAPRVGVIGCGYWGKNLVRNFHDLGALGAIADLSSQARGTAASIAPGVPIYEDLDSVFADESIAGIVIATPAETHAELSARAIRAGKDVLCEKPLALSYEDAYHVDALASQHGRILMVGHILEYHPAIRKLHELTSTGELGQIRYIYSNRINLGRVRREENILWSFAPHDLAVILRLVGAMPFQVLATGGAYVQPNIADVTVTQLQFDNGVAAHVFVSWLNPFKEQKLVVVGSERMASFDNVRHELVLHEQHVDLQDGEPIPVRGEGTHIPYALDEPLRLECRAFLDAICSRTPPLTDGGSALRVLRVLQAAQRSLVAQGQPVRLPPE